MTKRLVDEQADDQDRAPSSGVGGRDRSFPIVGVGASAGGLEAFTQLLKHLPGDSGMAFVLIQHLDPTQPSFLGEALAKATAMRVSQPENHEAVEPNHVYVISPNADLSITDGHFSLVPRDADARRPHLPIDFFFRALAAERGSHAIGVVLSGSASDGSEGLRAIKAESGITFAQDPASAKFAEMPQSAVNARVVDYELPIPDLAREIVRLSLHPYVAACEETPSPGDVTVVAEIIGLVRKDVGVDFGEYKGPTFERRLARRMVLRRSETLRDYLALLRAEPAEVRALYEDVLIHVTSFFRDREAFEALQSQILPAILKDKLPDAPIRIWVAGCATGEEVYSLGIVLLELMGTSGRPLQIFGSDLSEAIIAKARAGIYQDSALRQVSDDRRRRYFTKTERGYRINKAVRDHCVFVQHDLARDPPFSRIDLVSCRNVLIYFDAALQKRLIPIFHYSLNEPGYLLLGRTESISGFSQMFSAIDKDNKIFARTTLPSTLRFAPRFDTRPAKPRSASHDSPAQAGHAVDVSKHLDRMLLSRYAPPGVLINERMQVLQFRGQTGAFLQPAPGAPQADIIKMARPGLLAALRAATTEANRRGAPARRDGVEVDQDGIVRSCNLVVIPFTGMPEIKEPLYVVLFEPVTAPPAKRFGFGARRRKQGEPLAPELRIPKLEHELVATKDYLQSLIEEHGRATDDLGSVNEELVSGNEELQSMNEELETAKEELQSTNEELTTVNDELQSRNQEVTEANSDLVNLLATVDIPVVMLDRERRIRRFTPKARSIMNLLPSDEGRLFDDIKPNIDVVDLDRQITEVIATIAVRESEVQDRTGRWYRMQIRPYQTADNKIDGAILSLVDIDGLKLHVSDAQQARAEAESANRAKDLFLAVLGHELRTPLTSLLLQAQLLRRGGVADAAKLQRTGEVIERAAKMQMQLIDDLLDVSRIVAGKLSMERRPVDLRGVVKAAVDVASESARRKGVALEVIIEEMLGMVAGDPSRLQQVVTNLLTNAIKFTPAHGRVVIAVDAPDGSARIKVSDTGRGIEAAFLPHVFNRFSQEDTSNTRTHGGLGLGLAIVRHLVEQHGGTVRAESGGAGQGATFIVTLPLLKALGELAPDGPVSPPARQLESRGLRDPHRIENLRVLVVDDDRATRESVAEMLSGLGARVRIAESGTEAMVMVREFRPEVLLCDLAMPEEDGFTFIRRLRALGAQGGGDVPALALTALATASDRRQSLEAGFQRHLSKPVDAERLFDAVAELAEEHRPD